MTSAPLDDLASAIAATGAVISGITDDQWDAPTPCPEWTTRQLLDHLVAGNLLFVEALGGAPPAPAGGSDAAATYRRSVDALEEVFAREGALEQVVTVPFGTVPGAVALHLRVTELLVHGWDLARATGQGQAFPDDVAERELAFSLRALDQIPADRQPFGPPQPVADTAPAIDRLVACLGRSVGFRPASVAG